MIYFEDFGEELTNSLIAIISAIIIYFAWKSTNVREDRLPAILIIDNRNTLTTNSISAIRRRRTLRESSSNSSNSTEEVDLEIDRESTPIEDLQISEPPSFHAILDEVNDLATSAATASNYANRSLQAVEEDINELLEDSDSGPRQIIEDMDNQDTAEGLRRRRLAFYERGNNSQIPVEESSTSNNNQNDLNQQEPMHQQQQNQNRRENLNIQSDDSHAENCSNENNENENISKTENNCKMLVVKKDNSNEVKDDEFRIKLKYLNDELRLVKGSPNEAIGDFKKRNFTMELAAQKLVRLVFNGHVLQPDSKTLQACGLFDNCVVHCLIHNKRPTTDHFLGTIRSTQNRDQNIAGQTGIGSTTFSERSGNGPLFIYMVITFISLFIIFCWYCRVQYSYLFSWYSTSGLILMSALLLVSIPVILMVERDVTTT